MGLILRSARLLSAVKPKQMFVWICCTMILMQPMHCTIFRREHGYMVDGDLSVNGMHRYSGVARMMVVVMVNHEIGNLIVKTETTEALGIRSGGAFIMDEADIVSIWEKKTMPSRSINLANETDLDGVSIDESSRLVLNNAGANVWKDFNQVSSPLVRRFGFSLVQHEGKMYAYAMKDVCNVGGIYDNDMYRLDIESAVWTKLAPTGTAPAGRILHTAVVHDGKMYVFGGRNLGLGAYYNDMHVYDVAANSWTILSPLGTAPTVRCYHSAVMYDGRMYVFGGYDGSAALNDLYYYDIDANSWTKLTATGTAPSARYGHSAVEYNGKMYIFSGNGDAFANDMYRYDIRRNIWTKLPVSDGVPSARHLYTAVMHNGKMYMFGGSDGSHYDDLHQYDINSNSWTHLKPHGDAPTGRYHARAVAYNGNIYMLGGYGEDNVLDDFYRYGITENTWTVLTPTVPSLRYMHSSIELNGKMYVFGGLQESGKFLSDLYEMDILTGLSTLLAPLSSPPEMSGHSAVEYNGKMYVFGGYNGTYFNDMHVYEVAANSWTKLSPLGTAPTVRCYHSAVMYDGRMYVFGGHNGSAYLDDLYYYDIDANSWTKLTATGTVPTGRSSHAAVVYNGKMYVICGRYGTALNDIYRYDIAGNSWSKLAPGGTIPSARYYLSAVIHGGKIYIFGGSIDNVFANDLYYYDIVGNSWTKLTPSGTVPSVRCAYVMANYEDLIAVFGGAGAAYYNDMYLFDIPKNKWSLPSMTRKAVSAVVYHDDTYVFGGISGTVARDRMLKFKHDSGIWSILPFTGTSPIPRYGHSAAVHNNSMFVYGGRGTSNVLNDLFKYAFETSIWTNISTSGTGPGTLHSHSAVVYNNSMYVFGGTDEASYENCLYRLDLNNYTWSIMSSINAPSERFGHSAVVFDGKMYVFGGHTGVFYLNDLYMYDIAADTWLLLNATGTVPSIRHYHSAVVYNGIMFIHGGYDGASYFNDVYAYDIRANLWTKLSPGGIVPVMRYQHAVTINSHGKMLVFGGQTVSGIIGEISVFTFQSSAFVNTAPMYVPVGASVIPNIVQDTPAGTDIKYAVTFDDGKTYVIWNDDDGQWTRVNDAMTGMNVTSLISSVSNYVVPNHALFRIQSFMSTTSSSVPAISSVSIDFTNATYLELLSNGVDYRVLRGYPSKTVALFNLKCDDVDWSIIFTAK